MAIYNGEDQSTAGGSGGDTERIVEILNEPFTNINTSRWTVNAPTNSSISVVGGKVRFTSDATFNPQPTLTWTEKLTGTDLTFQFHLKNNTTNNDTALTLGLEPIRGDDTSLIKFGGGRQSSTHQAWLYDPDGAAPDTFATAAAEMWVRVHMTANGRFCAWYYAAAASSVPSETDWTEYADYKTYLADNPITPCTLVIRLESYAGTPNAASWDISNLTIHAGGIPYVAQQKGQRT